MTQLVELREGHDQLEAAGVKLYAVSYDDQQALAEFVEVQRIPYPMLSDTRSRVIREYGILNTSIEPGDLPVYGVPYPGTYVIDEDGVVVEKFFHDSYKKRDGPENLIDAALGKILLPGDEPSESGGDDDVRISATLHGAKGVLKQGAMRRVVVRFELRDGMHIYGEPVPEGMIATTVTVKGPPGLVVENPILPATETLRLESLDLELQVWSGVIDIVVPVYPMGELLSEMRPLEQDSATLEVTIRYQACDDRECMIPRTEKLTLEVPLAPVDVQSLSFHKGHGQREASMNSVKHLLRLILRIIRENPIGAIKAIARNIRLTRDARRRRKRARRQSQ